MLVKACTLALVGAVAVSAIDSRAVHSIVTRQLSSSSIPSACQNQCTSALSIYQACQSGDTQTCLSVCQSNTYTGFVGCLNCIVQDTPGVSQSDVDELNSALSQLSSACAAAGQTVSAASLVAPSGAAEGTDSASGAVASFTSATGVIIGGASSAAASSVATATSSRAAVTAASSGSAGATGAASSAASAAASSTGAARSAVNVPNFAGVLVGLVGIGAGAAYIL